VDKHTSENAPIFSRFHKPLANFKKPRPFLKKIRLFLKNIRPFFSAINYLVLGNKKGEGFCPSPFDAL
jgi:hypothetical protein